MALLHIDGADHRSSSFTSNPSGVSIQPGRYGGYSYQVTNEGASFIVNISPSGDTVTVGTAMWWANTGNNYLPFFRNSTTQLAYGVSDPTNRQLRAVVVATNTTHTTTLPTGVQGGSWNYFEIKVRFHPTAGSITIRIDNVVALNVTGINTGSTIPNNIEFRRGTGTGQPRFDDIYILDGSGASFNDFLGEVRIHALYPNGNGASSQWVGSDGNSTDNYLLVDDIAAGAVNTTDYVASAVDGNRDLYLMTDLPTLTGRIGAATVSTYAAKSDAGARSFRNILRSGTTDHASTTDNVLSASWAWFTDRFDISPFTGQAWTTAEINALQAGVEVRP